MMDLIWFAILITGWVLMIIPSAMSYYFEFYLKEKFGKFERFTFLVFLIGITLTAISLASLTITK